MADQLRDIVLSIYDTTADQSLWPSVLDRFANEINAQGCIIFEWTGTEDNRQLNAPFFSSFFEPVALRTYIDKCFAYEAADQDVFEAHSLSNDGIDLIDDSVLAPNIAELKKRKNVEVLQKFGILHRAAGLLNKDNTAHSRFSVQLNAARGRLDPAERAHMSMVLPHIAKALDLSRPAMQLAAQNKMLLAAIDQLTIGVCVLDDRGRIVAQNEEFRRQSSEVRVFKTAPNGTLAFVRPEDQLRLTTLMEDALNHGKFGARPRKEAMATDSGGFLCVEVTPLNHSTEIGSKVFGGYVIYSTDTSRPLACNTRPLQRAYGLTDAELEVVNAMAEGLTNTQIADRRDRSVATINTQVKSILSKTHCTTRTQFVRLMMSFGASHLNDGNL